MSAPARTAAEERELVFCRLVIALREAALAEPELLWRVLGYDVEACWDEEDAQKKRNRVAELLEEVNRTLHTALPVPPELAREPWEPEGWRS